jgi:UbiD family decarboxylase
VVSTFERPVGAADRAHEPKSLQGYLAELRRQSGELATVSRTIDPAKFEVTALLQHLDNRKQYPAVLFENPLDLAGRPAATRLASNIFATRERCAEMLGLPRTQTRMELGLHFARLERGSIPPRVVSRDEAPAQAAVLQDDEADLHRLPVVRHYELDLGPVITMAHVMKSPDPSEPFYDISFCKTFPESDGRAGVSIHTPHLERLLASWEARGEPIPIVNVLGHHPAFWLGALALAPWANDDYAMIGSFLGEPLRLVPSVTWGDDFLVPADAELIVEGELLPGQRTVVDPFGEVTRLYQAQCLRPVMRVKAITHRPNAIMQNIFSGHRGHWNLGAIPKEGSLFGHLQRKFGNISAVSLPYSGCGRLAAYISIKKAREGDPKQVALEALLQSWTFQTIVIVDEDIDVFNEEDVLWAVHTYVEPRRDVDVVKNVGSSLFSTAMNQTKLLIDATRPTHIAFPTPFRVPPDAMARVRLEEWLDA